MHSTIGLPSAFTRYADHVVQVMVAHVVLDFVSRTSGAFQATYGADFRQWPAWALVLILVAAMSATAYCAIAWGKLIRAVLANGQKPVEPVNSTDTAVSVTSKEVWPVTASDDIGFTVRRATFESAVQGLAIGAALGVAMFMAIRSRGQK